MSKIKSDLIQKKYKDTYLCKEGHNIIWEGATHIYKTDLKCSKCGEYGKIENPIRWCCSQCQNYFCCNCYNIIMDKLCPKNHKYKYFKLSMLENFTYYTCDICYKKFYTKDGVLFDKECNITICPKCFLDSCDIPETLED